MTGWTLLDWDVASTWPSEGELVLAYVKSWHIGQAWHGAFDLDGEFSASRNQPLWWQPLPAPPAGAEG